MNDNLFSKSNLMYIDEEQLKEVSGYLRKYSSDLTKIKKHFNEVWEQCSTLLDDNTIKNINSLKDINDKKYSKAMEELETYANKIDTVANIWQDTNIQIKNSSKNLESMFIDISKSIDIKSNNINKE